MNVDDLMMVPPSQRDWVPICAKCKKPVERFLTVSDDHLINPAVRRYVVYCHGEREESFVGVWAAEELSRKRQRLPDAFATAKENPKAERPLFRRMIL